MPAVSAPDDAKRHSRAGRLLAVPVLLILLSACAPTAAILSLFEGQEVSGVVTIDNEITSDEAAGPVTATEDIGGVNVPLDPESSDGVIDTETLPNGEQTVTLNASNNDGTSTDSVTVDIQNPPIPGSVGVVGDSISYDSFNSTGSVYNRTYFGNVPQDLVLDYWPGFTVSSSQPRVEQWATGRRPEILVIADGVNDAKPAGSIEDGYSQADRDNLLTMLDTIHDSACTVLVLPGWGSGLGETAYDQEYIVELYEVRSLYQELDAQRADIVTVDWQAVIDTHPEYMDPVDGIHLAPKADGGPGWDTAAATARQVMYWDGVAQCQAVLAAV
jgi:hypothetical protein